MNSLFKISIFFLLTAIIFSCSESGEHIAQMTSESDPRDSSTIKMAAELAEISESILPLMSNYRNRSRIKYFLDKSKEEQQGIKKLEYFLRSQYETLLSGETEKALQGFDQAENYARQMNIAQGQPVYRLINEFRSVAFLRLGEQKNCLLNHNEQSCLLPFGEKAFHIEKAGSQSAIESISALLREKEDLNFIWVLNIAYMTLGQYPNNVPPAWLIPLHKQENKVLSNGKFINVSDKLGIDDNRLSGGVVIEDFDLDGDLDIMTSSWSLEHQVFFYENDGKGNFENKFEEAGLKGITGGLNLTHGDYNNDGYFDLFIPRGAWLYHGEYPNSLLRNNGDGTFTDVTLESGIYSKRPTQTATWADFNNDGWLDIFIGNETYSDKIHPCELWLNDGRGGFENVADHTQCGITGFFKGVASGDFDNDGDQDIYLSNMAGSNYLLRNDQTDTDLGFAFTNVASEAGVEDPVQSFPCWFFDVNNDGWEDIFVSAFPHEYYNDFAAEYAKEMLGQENNIEKPIIYINNGNGTFSNQQEEYNINTTCYSMGANFGDLNNDGFLDFYVGTGEPDFKALIPNRMFLNIDGKSFEEVTAQGGFGHLQKGHAISFADLNNDGQQDVYAVMGGAYEGDVFFNALFLNPGTDNPWVKLLLEGVESNKGAYGARVKVSVASADKIREIYRTVSSGSSFGENPAEVHIGILPNETIINVEISWPSGYKQTIDSIGLRRKYHIIESKSPKVITYNAISLDLSKKHVHHHH